MVSTFASHVASGNAMKFFVNDIQQLPFDVALSRSESR